jgi:hypothetical protein
VVPLVRRHVAGAGQSSSGDHVLRVYDVGRVSHFAIVTGPPPIPSGVLCLVKLYDNDIGRGVFEAVACGELWAFSLGGNGRKSP